MSNISGTCLPNYFVDGTEEAGVSDYLALLKPRVMSLVIFTALCGLLMAPGSIHPILAFAAILSIAAASGAAGCLNMWWDRDIDNVMTRTQNRPLPQGRIEPDSALAFGIILSFISLITMGVAIHWLAASLLAVTILFYMVIYTMWLKRWTPHNIVIGGAAGALPPVIGWSAVTGTTPGEAWILFGIIFLWTPPHFWALSLYNHDDYANAKIPILPVTAGIEVTKRQILIYTFFLILLSIVPSFVGMASWVYLMVAILLGAVFFGLGWRAYRLNEKKPAVQLFAYSIIYLFILFLALTLDRMFL